MTANSNTYRPGTPKWYLLFLWMIGVLLSSQPLAAQDQDGGVTEIKVSRLTGAGQIVTGANVITTDSWNYEQTKKIKNIIGLTVNEETGYYIPENFSATVFVHVEYGPWAAPPSGSFDIPFTVNYDKQTGAKYAASKYMDFVNASAVNVQITDVQAPVLSNGLDTRELLVLQNEMQVTRYYELAAGNLTPSSFDGHAPASLPADALNVTWGWPVNAGNNQTQLEWTWLEDELENNYKDAGGNIDYRLLFKNNATRIDLPVNQTSYNIPLFYDGVGKLYFRIRAVNIKESGSRSDGPWSVVRSYAYGGHDNNLNWQVTTTFAEEGKRKTVMQYYDGSLRMRQTVTKDNVTNTTVTAETLYDGEGRTAVQILPAPGINNILAYTKNLNLFNGQNPADNPANFFDIQPGNPADLVKTSGAARYYSDLNSEITSGVNAHIPDAEGYPYMVTRYTPDATGRVMSQSGAGAALKMGSNHESKYYYGAPAQEELDGLFGTEAGNYTHYFKNMVKDANGQMSISYADMHGRTIATSLAGDEPAGMAAVPKSDSTMYPGQAGTAICRNLLDVNSNIVQGNAIESVNSLLVPVSTNYHFRYSLNPDTVLIGRCNNSTPLCFDCLYDLEISITDESGDGAPIVRKFNNVSLTPDDTASTPVPPFIDEHYNNNNISTVANNVITFDAFLQPGSYAIRKTLTISEASFEKYKDEYLDKALCKSKQDLINSIYAELLTNYDCNDPATRAVPATNHRLGAIRSLMLSDMMPYTGQYARENAPASGPVAMYNTYDIFSTANSGQPFYKYPLNSAGNAGTYTDAFGNTDLTIYPDGSNQTLLSTTKDEFAGLFTTSWAGSLLPHHPEYNRLVFAENNLASSYDWIDDFSAVSTYAVALAGNTGSPAGYVTTAGNPQDKDPFFTVAPASYKTAMNGFVSGNSYYGFSLWQLAFGDATCKTIIDPGSRDNCYLSTPAQPGSTSVPDQVWGVFRELYRSVRDSMLNAYISDNVPLSNGDQLVSEGYILRFPTNNTQLAQQYNWTWFPATAGDAPQVAITDAASATYNSRCSAYIDEWRRSLLQCPALNASPYKEQILSEIINGMLAVCQQGTDEANPYGASTVAPNTPAGSPRSFEEVVNAVFQKPEYHIAADQFCNPFVIESPKPYGQGPVFTKSFITLLDTCTCSQFAKIKQEAAEASYNPYVLSSLNQYLRSKYKDTLTTALYNIMQEQCGNLKTQVCPPTCNDCRPVSDCRDTVVYYPVVPAQPMPEFIKCGFASGSACLICDSLQVLTARFRSYFGAPYNTAPVFTGNDLTPEQLGYNVLYAKFINYYTGLQYTWLDYAKAAASVECDVTSTAATDTQTVICRDPHPLNDTTGVFAKETPCQRIYNMAIALAEETFSRQKAQLLADFEARYRAKCLSAQQVEHFSVDYLTSEYHYTLYYYDQAGNLVKTVPPKGVRPHFDNNFVTNVKNARASGASLPVVHEFLTNYRYNSLNQVVAKKTPDADVSYFWYDKLGRLAVSQHAQQYADSKYSYTLYDDLGRITEVGQKPQTTLMNQGISQDPVALNTWINTNGGTKEQITFTVYDIPYPPLLASWVSLENMPMQTTYITQQNLRNRVSYIGTKKLATDDGYYTATFYTYDIHGNVDTLVQDFRGVSAMDMYNRFKRICYQYDLISGKVNAVDYQPGANDAFYHRYQYDAENRLITVETSRDKNIWERDAAYNYYKHGPASRMELGKLRVQGLDYAYTLQGWLKGVNSTTVGNGAFDIGRDGYVSGLNSNVARDAIGFALHYYDVVDNGNTWVDYKAIGGSSAFARINNTVNTPLYNGNVSGITINNAGLNAGAANTLPLNYSYKYDQLNRLVQMQAYKGLNAASNTFVPELMHDYKEMVSYDPNGNILTYTRRGTTSGGNQLMMDSMRYNYYPDKNQLSQIIDEIPSGNYTTDLDAQPANNYAYDAIGNLTADVSSGINANNIKWSVYGKIISIVNSSGTITYSYDAMGNRISKATSADTTVYVRDGQGNVVSVYQKAAGASMQQSECHLYGSSRLGIVTKQTTGSSNIYVGDNFGFFAHYRTFTRGEKLFELTNHLGNVLATVTDKKLQHTSNNSSVDYYDPAIASATDYYPFGMQMPGRTYSSTAYRYGFNGKENDNEVKGTGNEQDYGMRIYDPRVGRFLSVDPIEDNYPHYSPYQFAGNMPLAAIDLDGLEEYVVTHFKDKRGKIYRTEVAVITNNKDKPFNQHVQKAIHKNGEESGSGVNVVKGSVLVFEVYNEHTKNETVKIVQDQSKADSKISADDLKIYKDKRELLADQSETEYFSYPTDRTRYVSKPFDNDKANFYVAEKKLPREVWTLTVEFYASNRRDSKASRAELKKYIDVIMAGVKKKHPEIDSFKIEEHYGNVDQNAPMTKAYIYGNHTVTTTNN